MPSVQELHDVERASDDAAILTETVGLGDRHIGLFQGMDDLVFPLDFVSRLREQLARGFLAEDVFTSVGGSELVGRIGLAKAELRACELATWEKRRAGKSLITCFTSRGVLIAGTLWSR